MQIGGISTAELNCMELELMRRLGYKLLVPLAVIEEQLACLNISLPAPAPRQQRPKHGHKRHASQSPPAQLPCKTQDVSAG